MSNHFPRPASFDPQSAHREAAPRATWGSVESTIEDALGALEDVRSEIDAVEIADRRERVQRTQAEHSHVTALWVLLAGVARQLAEAKDRAATLSRQHTCEGCGENVPELHRVDVEGHDRRGRYVLDRMLCDRCAGEAAPCDGYDPAGVSR